MSRATQHGKRSGLARRPRAPFRKLRLEPLEDRRVLASLSLSTLNALGVTLYGVDAGDQSGIAVSDAGDVNGDGFDDIVIGARYADALNNAKVSAGDSYLIFGKADWSNTRTIDLANLGTAGVTIYGANLEDYSGRAVSSAGDINGDGFDDLLIGAGGGDAAGNAKLNAGESYVIFGKANWTATPTIDLQNLGAAGVVLYGADALDVSGRAVSSAGDVNGDGYDDLLMGAPLANSASNARPNAGEAALVFGKPDWSATPTVDLGNLGNAGVTIHGINTADNSGLGVSRGGDINGDGFDDLLIGAQYGDAVNNTRATAGESYVLFGKANWAGTLTLDLAGLATAGITFFGASINDYSGLSLSGAGDVNGDGFDDLLIGAVGGDGTGETRSNSGESYLIFGKATWTTTPTVDLSNLGTTGVTFFGADEDDTSGIDVHAAGDVNGDGLDDLIIGARFADADNNAKTSSGDTYVVFGRKSWTNLFNFQLANLAGNGITIWGADTFDYSGYTVSGGGDINGDGFDDILIGAATADAANNNKSNAGESYIVFGGNGFTGSVSHLGTPNSETLTGTAGGNTMVGHRGDDTLIGNGGADVLIGGSGNDILAISDLTFDRVVGGNGIDTLRLDGNGLPLDLTAIRDNRILDIERIDTRGSGTNTLTLNLLEVLNLSQESNTLVVLRDGVDTVNRGDGWAQQPNEVIDGTTFEVFTQGAAILKVQFDVADLAVAMTSSATTVLAGGTLSYTVTTTNNGPSAATGVKVTSTIPLGLLFDSSNSSAHCSAVGQAVTCNVGTIANGANAGSQIGVRVASNVTHGSLVSHTVLAASSQSDLIPANNSSAVSVTVNRQADIKITKVPSASPVGAGGQFFYTMQVVNSGPSDASGVVVTDTLPAGLAFDAVNSTGICTAAGQQVTCNLGNMTAGSSTLPQVAVTVDAGLADGTVIQNTADVTSNEPDPSAGDRSSTAPITVSRQADLRMTMTASANPVIAGGAFTYTLTVANLGPASAGSVTVSDTLPTGLTFDGATSSAECSAVGQVVTCNVGTLVINDLVTRTLGVLVDGGLARRTQLANSAAVDGDGPDPAPANDTSSVTVVVNVTPDPFPWQNVRDPFDVNNDRAVTPIDALVLVNELNVPKFRNEQGQLPLPPPVPTHPFLDVSGDNFVVPGDVLQVVNFLNSLGGGEGEDESVAAEVDESLVESVASRLAAGWVPTIQHSRDQAEAGTANPREPRSLLSPVYPVVAAAVPASREGSIADTRLVDQVLAGDLSDLLELSDDELL